MNPLVLANAEDLQQAIEEKLKSVGVAQRARNRAMAMVALAGGCLQAMQELEAMIGSSGPRLEELRNMLIATERIGWWIGELYPWLHTFATVLVDTEPDSGESD
ncbi:MAG: hypothetical protein HY664_04865 [Chloroflexi bacterium]|nr:hypothetical protein [Chloroflexota bacterium]